MTSQSDKDLKQLAAGTDEPASALFLVILDELGGWPRIGQALPMRAVDQVPKASLNWLQEYCRRNGMTVIRKPDCWYFESTAWMHAVAAAAEREISWQEAYILDNGWSAEDIQKVATHGVTEAMLDRLGSLNAHRLMDWCKANTEALEPDPPPALVVAIRDDNLVSSTVVRVCGRATNWDDAIHAVNQEGLTLVPSHFGARHRFVQSWGYTGPAYLIDVEENR